jgi:hypothetical protein
MDLACRVQPRRSRNHRKYNPEYGATIGFFPRPGRRRITFGQRTRWAHDAAEAYAKAWKFPDGIQLNIRGDTPPWTALVEPSIAGPRFLDRVPLAKSKQAFGSVAGDDG